MGIKENIEQQKFMNNEHEVHKARESRKDRLTRLLDSVNYGDEYINYKPSEFTLDYMLFIKMCSNGMGESNISPIMHTIMLDQIDSLDPDKENIANLCFRGSGKLQPLDSIIHTPNGTTTMGKIKKGDLLFDGKGNVQSVIYKTEVTDIPVYKITMNDGSSFECGDDHNHVVYPYGNKYREKVVTTKQLLAKPLWTWTKRKSKRTEHGHYTWRIPLIKPLNYKKKKVPIDPYLYGYGLVAGVKGTDQVSVRNENLNVFIRKLKNAGLSENCKKTHLPGMKFSLIKVDGMLGHIPKPRLARILPIYKLGSKKQRLELLRGLMDGRGILEEVNSAVIRLKSKMLARDIRELVSSLGGMCTISKYMAGPSKMYMCRIRIKFNIFAFNENRNKWNPSRNKTRAIKEIKYLGKKKGCCIKVTGDDCTYVTDGYVMTHNTTAISEYFILYTAVRSLPNFGEFKYGVFVTDTIENGVKKMRNRLDVQMQNSAFLKKYLTRRFTDIRWYFKNVASKEIVWGGFGIETGVRGTVELKERPSVLIFDDIFSDKNADSTGILKKIHSSIYGALEFAMNPAKTKVIWNGTPFNASDPLYKAMNAETWYPNVYPICEKFPCSKEEFRGAWEDRFSYEWVKKKYDKAVANNSLAMFYRELMLQIASTDEKLVKPHFIQWYNLNALVKAKSNFNFYITTDLGTSNSATSDWKIIFVWAINNVGQLFLVDGICEKNRMSVNIDRLFALVSKWKPMGVGIEVSGQQDAFVDWIKERMIDANVFFSIARETDSENIHKGKEGFKPTINKLQRFKIALPLLEEYKIHVPLELANSQMVIEFLEELDLATDEGLKSEHDDAIDAFSQLPKMNMVRPSADSKNVDLKGKGSKNPLDLTTKEINYSDGKQWRSKHTDFSDDFTGFDDGEPGFEDYM